MPPRDDKFVLIGPTGWQLLGLAVIMGVIWWWLARKPGAPPPMIWVAIRAIWWRLFPALSTWHETNQEKARARFGREGVNDFEEDEEPRLAPRPQPAHMSSQEPAPEYRIAAVPGEAVPNQGRPSPEPDLTYDKVFRDTVLLKNKQGGWQHSGKKLYALWGGNHDECLAKVRALRGESVPDELPPAPEHTPRTLRVRDSGVERHISIDPELEYQPPNGI